MTSELSNGFDYAAINTESIDRLKFLEKSINGHLVDIRGGMLSIGEYLTQAQEELADHSDGTFGKWVEESFPLSRRTAYNMIAAFKIWGQASCATVAQLEDTAMYRLASSETPKLALNAARKMAEKGQLVTAKIAEELIRKYKPAAPKEERPKTKPAAPAADTETRTDPGGGMFREGVLEEETTEQPELSMQERIDADNKALESYCREVLKVFQDRKPDNPWLEERGLWNSALAGIKAALGTVRNAKQVLCPACDCGQNDGGDCTFCLGNGGLPKTMSDCIPEDAKL